MATDPKPFYTFYPSFNEFLPVYRNISRVWIGDGTNTGEAGMLLAEYETGEVVRLGYVTSYEYAQDNGYQGTAAEWASAIISLVGASKAAITSVSYLTTEDGVNHPASDAEWESTPAIEKGKYLWTKFVLSWVDSSKSELYLVTYTGQDGQVESVNGSVGNVVLNGANLTISNDSNETIKSYIDNLVFEPNVATKAQIDALFTLVPPEPSDDPVIPDEPEDPEEPDEPEEPNVPEEP